MHFLHEGRPQVVKNATYNAKPQSISSPPF